MKNKIFLFFLLTVLMCGLAGCESFRKKFVRKKTEAPQQNLTPVFQPVEYPDPYQTAAEEYRYHQTLGEVWYKELMIAFQDKSSGKRLVYILNRMIAQMEAMERLLNGALQIEMRAWVEMAKSIVQQLDVPAAVRPQPQIQMDLQVVGRAIGETFAYENVKEFIQESGVRPLAES